MIVALRQATSLLLLAEPQLAGLAPPAAMRSVRQTLVGTQVLLSPLGLGLVLHWPGGVVTLQVWLLITLDGTVLVLKNDQLELIGDIGAIGVSPPAAQSGALATCSNEAQIHSPWLKVLLTKWKPTRPKRPCKRIATRGQPAGVPKSRHAVLSSVAPGSGCSLAPAGIIQILSLFLQAPLLAKSRSQAVL